jgi:hypothetical protein
MMAYTDPQVINNLLSSLTTPLTPSTLSATCEAVRQPEQSLSTIAVRQFDISTHWYTFVSILVFPIFFCDFWRILTPLTIEIK